MRRGQWLRRRHVERGTADDVLADCRDQVFLDDTESDAQEHRQGEETDLIDNSATTNVDKERIVLHFPTRVGYFESDDCGKNMGSHLKTSMLIIPRVESVRGVSTMTKSERA